MKFSKEARIGLLVIISVFIFFAGFYYLKGSSLFSGQNIYYAYYESVQGLQPAAYVQIKGVRVGKVQQIKLLDSRVMVAFAVGKDLELPKGTVARLVSLDLLGTKAIRLEPGAGRTRIGNGETLRTAVESGIIDNLSEEISPLIADVRRVVGTLDTVLSGFDRMLTPETRDNFSASVALLNSAMQNFADLSASLNKESATLTSAIRNVNEISGNLVKNNDKIDRIVDNADLTAQQLRSAPIDLTVRELQSAATQLNSLIGRINSGEGSVGMAVTDKELYQNLTHTLTSLKSLISDVEAHPSRYINITIFGRKKKSKQ